MIENVATKQISASDDVQNLNCDGPSGIDAFLRKLPKLEPDQVCATPDSVYV